MFAEKITLLNQTVLECFNETDEKKIIKAFTEVGIKVLGANFGFVWLNSTRSNDLELVYESPNLPFVPKPPRNDGRNYKVMSSGEIDFVTDVKLAPDALYVSKHIQSFIIIPIKYQEAVYGNLVLCFKKREDFEKEKKVLSVFIGNSMAQAIKIHRLIENEYQARALSEQNEAYFRALMKSSNEIIILVDSRGSILYTSSSTSRIFDSELKDIVGENISRFIIKEDHKKFKNFLARVVASVNLEQVEEFKYKTSSGSLISLEYTGLNMLHNPSIRGVVIDIRDITTRKEVEVLKEKEIILQEEKIKTEFITNATHELRTPLAIIRGNVDLALRSGSKGDKDTKTALKDISHEIDHLSRMLSELTLLTVRDSNIKSKLYDPKESKDVNLVEVDLREIIKNVVANCSSLANEKNISINLSTKVPKAKVLGNVIYLEKLFTIILNNSILHGKRNGEVSIKGVKDAHHVHVYVRDNGKGIPETDLPYIFESFYKVDKSHTGHGGVGLGLAIAKWIILIHKGEIKVESKENSGTTFIISIPLLKAD